MCADVYVNNDWSKYLGADTKENDDDDDDGRRPYTENLSFTRACIEVWPFILTPKASLAWVAIGSRAPATPTTLTATTPPTPISPTTLTSAPPTPAATPSRLKRPSY